MKIEGRVTDQPDDLAALRDRHEALVAETRNLIHEARHFNAAVEALLAGEPAPSTLNLPATMAALRAAGGDGWDDVADPDAAIREMRGKTAPSADLLAACEDAIATLHSCATKIGDTTPWMSRETVQVRDRLRAAVDAARTQQPAPPGGAFADNLRAALDREGDGWLPPGEVPTEPGWWLEVWLRGGVWNACFMYRDQHDLDHYRKLAGVSARWRNERHWRQLPPPPTPPADASEGGA